MAGSQPPGEKLSATTPAKCPDPNNTRASGRFRTWAQSVRCLHQPEVPPSLSPLPHPKDQGDTMSHLVYLGCKGAVCWNPSFKSRVAWCQCGARSRASMPYSGHCCIVNYRAGTIEAFHPACTTVPRRRRRQRDSFAGDQQNGGLK